VQYISGITKLPLLNRFPKYNRIKDHNIQQNLEDLEKVKKHTKRTALGALHPTSNNILALENGGMVNGNPRL
jgi:hypothetical protein